MQVQGQLSLSCGAALTFGLAHYASSAFELIAEELLMSDSLIKACGLDLFLCVMAIYCFFRSLDKVLLKDKGLIQEALALTQNRSKEAEASPCHLYYLAIVAWK